MKKLFAIILSFAISLATGCSFNFDGNTGDATANLTKLPTPTVTEVVDGYVYWEEVSNASSYVVKINSYQESAGNSLKYSISSIMDSRIDYDTPTELHIYVMAKGNQILFGDSDWSQEFVCTYTKESSQSHTNKLNVPEITKYENNTVYWSNVENADKYFVKIDGTEYTTYDNFYTISLSNNGTFTFSVKAVSNNLNYAQSDWSSVNSYNYVKQYDSVYSQMGVGRGVNVVTAKSFSDYILGTSILNLNNIEFDEDTQTQGSSQKAISSHNITEIIESSTTTKEVNVGTNNKKRTHFLNIQFGFKSNASFEYKDYSDRFLYHYEHYIGKKRVYMVDYGNSGNFKQYLSSSYVEALSKLYANQTKENFDNFFKKYGTHIIASAVFGGRLSLYYSAVTNNAKISKDKTDSLELSIGLGKSSVNNMNVGVKSEIASKLGIEEKDIKTALNVSVNGGNEFAAASIEDFNENYKTWSESFNLLDEDKYSMVDYADDGLIALWDLLPEEYSSMYDNMINAFSEYHAENYQKVISDFSFNDNVNYAGGSGDYENPYLIANEHHLMNIEKNMSAHYKLTADIDLSGISDWEPIGGLYIEEGDLGFTGSLDGNGYSIKNLQRTELVPTVGSRSSFGLFGYVGSGAIIKNIKFENVKVHISRVTSDSNVRAWFGIVAGRCEGATITNIESSGMFKCDGFVYGVAIIGGLCGFTANSTIESCINNMEILSCRYYAVAGGILGYSKNTKIINCVNNGNIKAAAASLSGHCAAAGSIVAIGHNTNRSVIINCENTGKVVAVNGGPAGSLNYIGDENSCAVYADWDY